MEDENSSHLIMANSLDTDDGTGGSIASPTQSAYPITFVKALYNYTSQDDSSLTFQEGDIIEVLTKLPSGWWDGLLGDSRGWFPSNYVEEVQSHNDLQVVADYDSQDEFRSLRQLLVNGGHNVDLDGGDGGGGEEEEEDSDQYASNTDAQNAFEQLAEAAMLDSNNRQPHQARQSIVDLHPSLSSSSSSASSSKAIGPSQREVQIRSQQQQQNDFALTPAGRPRASTGLNQEFLPRTNLALASRDRSASTGNSHDRKIAKESDYWVPRYGPDGIVYYNTRTGAESRDIPDRLDLDYALSPHVSEEAHDNGDFDQDEDDLDLQEQHMPRHTSDYYLDRLRSQGRPGGGAHTSSPYKPVSMAKQEEEAFQLQSMLLPSPGPTLGQLLHSALERLAHLLDVSAEQLDAQGFSDQDKRAALNTPSLLDRTGIRLAKSTSAVVHSVRQLLYASAALNISAADLATIQDLVAFAAAPISLDHDKRYLSDTTATLPASLRATGDRVSSLLSKLVLSTRAATEQPLLSSSSPDEQAAKSHLDKLNAYRRRTREDAIELVNILDIFAHQLESQRATKRNPSWAKPLEATIQSGNGTSGVGQHSLNGGSAAGWKGAGFVTPSAYETAALRFEAQGQFQDPADLPPEARSLLASAKERMRRRPGQLLSETLVTQKVKPRLDEFSKDLKRLDHLVRSPADQSEETVDPSQSSSSPLARSRSGSQTQPAADSNSSTPDINASTLVPLQGAAAEQVMQQARLVLTRFGALLAVLEDIDFASVLDVDSASWDQGGGSGDQGMGIDEQIASLVYSAKEGLNTFSSRKQVCYDMESQILFEAQELSAVLAGCSAADVSISERLLEISEHLQSVSRSLVDVTSDIAQIAEEQARAKLGSIGARAKVYELEDVMVETSHLFLPRPGASQQQQMQQQQQQQQQQLQRHRGSDASASSMSGYLAPSISGAVGAFHPPGQRTTSLRSASSGAVSPSSTTLNSIRSGAPPSLMSGPNAGIAVAARNRSMSVATGGSGSGSSVLSSDPQRLRANTDAQQHDSESATDTESGRAPQRAGSKLRKFFGDDGGLSSSANSLQAQQAAPPSTTASTITTGTVSSATPTHATTGGASTPTSAPATATSTVPSAAPLQQQQQQQQQDVTPWFLQPDYDETEMVISPEGQIKGGTLRALMERLTMHNTYGASFHKTLLLTYRSFATTTELLDALFARFKISAPVGLSADELEIWVKQKQQPIQLRVLSVLKSWLETFFYEGEDEVHLDRIRNFVLEAQSPFTELSSRHVLRLVEKRQGDGEQMIRKMVLPQQSAPPPPILPKSRRIKFLDIDPTEMARQLTLLESKLYNKIKPMECLGKAWSKSDSEIHAKGIKDTISTSNRITGWVAEAILVQDDLKKRAAWIKQFITIADACRSLNNFSTMTAIVSGLNSAPVYRLKRSWDAVNQRYVLMLDNLNRIMQSSKNFSDYREMLHKLNPPCVPFLGVYLTDLTFIEDGNPDRLRVDEKLINFDKRMKTAEVIREIIVYQSTPYNLTPVAGIQKFIQDNLVEARSDSELYQQSLALEPREREDEKISRLLAESGFL